MKIYCYRYMWSIKDIKDKVNFKIITDTIEGLKAFEDSLKKLENIENIGREYLFEYDCSKIGLFEDLKNI